VSIGRAPCFRARRSEAVISTERAHRQRALLQTTESERTHTLGAPAVFAAGFFAGDGAATGDQIAGATGPGRTDSYLRTTRMPGAPEGFTGRILTTGSRFFAVRRNAPTLLYPGYPDSFGVGGV
jgi:hypothetical protein